MLIDVHAHQFPQKYIETIARHGRQPSGLGTDQTIEERLRLMDEALYCPPIPFRSEAEARHGTERGARLTSAVAPETYPV